VHHQAFDLPAQLLDQLLPRRLLLLVQLSLPPRLARVLAHLSHGLAVVRLQLVRERELLRRLGQLRLQTLQLPQEAPLVVHGRLERAVQAIVVEAELLQRLVDRDVLGARHKVYECTVSNTTVVQIMNSAKKQFRNY
jgi:hypothetical protein